MSRVYVKQARLADIYSVAVRMRDRDHKEISATSFTDNREEIAERLATSLNGFPFAFVVGDDDVNDGLPIVSISWVETHPGVWSVGMFATDDMPKVGAPLTRFVCKRVIPALGERGVRRVYANSICGYQEVHRWLRFLGMTHEAPMPHHGKRGENFICFSWSRQNVDHNPLAWLGPGNVA